MYDIQPAFNDLARIKGKKQLTANNIDVIEAHLKEIKNQYLQYKLNYEVLERRYGRQPEPYQYKEGDKVIYIPVYANGDINHPNCERGTVSSVSSSDHGGHQNVWVRYTEGSTGAKTAYDCLVLDV